MRSLILLLAVLATGCTAPVLIRASDTYGKSVPPAVASLEEIYVGHVDSTRQRRILNWNAAPKAILGTPGFGRVGPADLDLVQGWLCNPSGGAQRFALNEVAGFGEGLVGISKAPADGLVAATNAINATQEKLNKIREDAKKAGTSTYKKHGLDCEAQVKKLFEDAFAVQVTSFPPDATRIEIRSAHAGAYLDLIFTSYDLLKYVAGLIEQKVRSDLIKAYALANEERIEAALRFIEGNGNITGATPQDKFTLQASIDDQMRFHMLMSIADANDAAAASPGSSARRKLAEAAADEAGRYEVLAQVDVNKDLLEPLAKANRKFIAIAKDPEPNFDDFMTAAATLRDKRDKWVKARDAWRAR